MVVERRRGRRARSRIRALVRALGWEAGVRSVAESVAIGLVAGAGAALFFVALDFGIDLVGAVVGGPARPRPLGEPALFAHAEAPLVLWALVLAPAVGGLVSGLLVRRFAPEAEGHGTDAMIRAFHSEGGEIRGRVPVVKALATVAVLATGGSAGREGPVIQMGAGAGSMLGRLLGVSRRRRRILLLAGAAGAVGAIFRAPLGGAIVAIEVLYHEDFETEALVPSIVSSVTAYALFAHFFGHGSIFRLPAAPAFLDARELIFYVLLGGACAAVGGIYIRLFRGTRRLFAASRIPPVLRPALGGLGVGLLALAVPQVLGAGWGEIQRALLGAYPAHVLLAVCLAKIVATCLSVGSGGSGGIFGPSLFIGGMLGGALGRTFHALAPGIAPDPAAYVLVGMAAFFAGVAKAPIGALVMTTEMTGSYGLLAPLMAVSVVAILLTRGESIYESQVPSKFHSPAHRRDLVRDLLGEIRVADLLPGLAEAPAPVPPTTPVDEIRRLLEAGDRPYLLVAGRDGAPRGLIEAEDFLAAGGGDPGPGVLAADVAVPLPRVSPRDDLRTVLARLLRAGVDVALVPARRAGEPRRVVTSDEIEGAHVRALDRER